MMLRGLRWALVGVDALGQEFLGSGAVICFSSNKLPRLGEIRKFPSESLFGGVAGAPAHPR